MGETLPLENYKNKTLIQKAWLGQLLATDTTEQYADVSIMTAYQYLTNTYVSAKLHYYLCTWKVHPEPAEPQRTMAR